MTSVHVPSRRADGVRIVLRPRDVAQSGRRQHQRFPITVQAQCILAGDGAQATPVDISSGAVFLKTNKMLQLGESIHVLIDWPAPLDQRCPLRLLIVSKVLRRNGHGLKLCDTNLGFATRPRLRSQLKEKKEHQDGEETKMKSLYMRKNLPATVITVAGILLLSFPCAAFAYQEVQWRKIVGIIQVGNAVGTGTGKVTGGGQPWFAISGNASVDLNKGELQFQVQGLVLAWGNAIGTRGGVTQVKGTLVCDTTGTLTGNSTLVDTALVSLSPQGNARFAGQVDPCHRRA